FIAQGPTTGLVVSADGYIVSSAFNFAQQPTSILVQLPSGEQTPAQLVAHDKNRMLVLLKVDTDQLLPVPSATPTDEIRVGQWAVAVGRTFRADRVAVSVGIVSALNRMYGRVIQTDASVSVANYGGPLVDLQGRVLGILVPMSPQSAGGEGSELAGAEFYDSGIGFAVPWEHVLGILERWQQGDDLLPGKLGVGLKRDGALFKPPEITTVWQGSPAAKAGWQPKDVIVAVDGQPVETQSQLRFLLVPRYAGDRLRVTIRRDEKLVESEVTLTGELAPFRHAFLGVLPMRDAPGEDAPDEDAPGVTLRSVWPQGPAARAGLQRGDRILKIGDSHLSNLDGAFEALSGLRADSSVKVVVERDKKERTLSAKLSTLPEEILSRDHLPQANRGPQENDDQPAELKPLKLLEFVQIARYYSPPQDESRPLGLLLWLAQGSAEEDQELADAWRADCRRDGLLLVVAHPQDEAGWSADEMEFLKTLLRTVRSRFEIDSHRAVVCGRGKAGQLAFALAFRRSNGLSGVIGIDAPLPRTLRLPANLPGHRLALLCIESKNSLFAPLIRKDIDRLREAGYPTSWLERPFTDGIGRELEAETRNSMSRWIDGLDRF
ncbi:MAG: PDZ domain-containing protein, partial [Planctomycetes bacterium]|nr:PDZ domain-containing protein [Planctomycetota bacterium]